MGVAMGVCVLVAGARVCLWGACVLVAGARVGV